VTIGPEFLGGVLFPAAMFSAMTLAPWLDRTNRRVLHRLLVLGVPLVVSAAIVGWSRLTHRAAGVAGFDPTSQD